jgi:hypothetical protein
MCSLRESRTIDAQPRHPRARIGALMMWLLALALPAGPLPAEAESEIFVATGSGVLVFPRTATGNVAPIRTLPGFGGTGGAFVDTVNNEVFVVDSSPAVHVYARTANGLGVAPVRTITGAATQLHGPFGIFVDTVHDEVYVAETGDNKLLVFPRTANGNVAPIRTIQNQKLDDTGYFDQLNVVVDLAHDEVLVTATKLNTDVILAFPRTANGTNVLPLREISGGSNAALEGMFLNLATDEIIVASTGTNEIRVYPRTANSVADSPMPFPPSRAIKGPSTGLDKPVGLDVDLADGEIIVSVLNNSSVRVFPLAGNGDVAPLRVITGSATKMQGNVQMMALGAIPGALPASLVASVLPASRSVKTGAVATAFATMINTSATPLGNCEIAALNGPPSSPPGYTFQTTNPATNQVVGQPGAPVTIPGNSAQTFVFAFTPTAAFGPVDVQLAFQCAGAALAPIITGLDTILLSASSTAVPDLIALAATTGNNGILDLTAAAPAGRALVVVGAFSVASANVGAAGSITVQPDTGSANLPLALSICQTNPQTGACLSGAGQSVTTQINAGETPTFAVFGTALSPIPFDPANNRVFVRYKDQGGVVRGSTSVAVRTP